MSEVWKEVPGYEGIYSISSDGRVKSCKRVIKYKDGRDRPVDAIILKQHIDTSGYYVVGLGGNTIRVHQIVAMAFLNHVPDKFNSVVDHIDTNKLNNKVSNLQIVSNRVNCTKDKGDDVGVYNVGTGYRATIRYNGKNMSIGTHKTKKLARKAYKEAFDILESGGDLQPIIDKYKSTAKSNNQRKVAQLDDNNIVLRVFDSVMEASRFVGRNAPNITSVCKGTRKRVAGYKWAYYIDSQTITN